MIDTKLIMLEGMAGTGKTTNSYFLQIQLERNKNKLKWIHEVARPHLTSFFDEAVLTYEEYSDFLKKYPKTVDILNKIAVFRKSTIGIDLLDVVDGLTIKDPNGDMRELIPKSETEFYVGRLPTILRFDAGQIMITGVQIPERWTTAGTIYKKLVESES